MYRCSPMPQSDPMFALLRGYSEASGTPSIPHERCIYDRGLGAGPGPTATYYVDLPLPWGKNTEITLPMEQLMNDAWASMEPNANAAIARGAVAVAAAVALAVGLGAWWVRSGR